MIIHIHDNLTLSDLQERFSKCFPALKIQFYTRPHALKKPSDENDMIHPSKKVEQARHIHTQGELELKSWHTVARVEKDFREKFGLNVQVFRNENGEWVQSSITDKFTLRDQQEMSRHAASSVHPQFREQLGEYDEL